LHSSQSIFFHEYWIILFVRLTFKCDSSHLYRHRRCIYFIDPLPCLKMKFNTFAGTNKWILNGHCIQKAYPTEDLFILRLKVHFQFLRLKSLQLRKYNLFIELLRQRRVKRKIDQLHLNPTKFNGIIQAQFFFLLKYDLMCLR
jgi:hypothetical protein